MKKIFLFIACLLALWATSGLSESAPLDKLEAATIFHYTIH